MFSLCFETPCGRGVSFYFKIHVERLPQQTTPPLQRFLYISPMITTLQLADGSQEVLNSLQTTRRKYYHVPTDITNHILIFADRSEIRNYNRKFSCYNFDYSYRITLEEDPKQFTEYVVMKNILAN